MYNDPPKWPVTRLAVTGASYTPPVTAGYRRTWPPPKDFKQNGRSQQQMKDLCRMQASVVSNALGPKGTADSIV
eukprot:157011-Heterocapsa_arctica.AAC.1